MSFHSLGFQLTNPEPWRCEVKSWKRKKKTTTHKHKPVWIQKKSTGEILSVFPPRGHASIKVIHRTGPVLTVRDATEVHLRRWFYWWHQVTRWPLWRCYAGCFTTVPGHRNQWSKSWRRGRWEYTGSQKGQCFSKNNMQTPAFREIDTLPQAAERAFGE